VRTVRDVTYQLLREFGLTTIFGNVGSTEETFLKDFPSDFRYVLALQASPVIKMADGFAQSWVELGNAMGPPHGVSEQAPLIVTAGQQTREMLLMEPWLTNVEAAMLPRPG
jgi:benzoylformate decarboxylase